MPPLVLAASYAHWHYGQAFRDMYRVWTNLIWFVFNFFSIATLISTFFQPFKRLDEGYPKGFDPAAWIQTLIVNVLMRFVGAMVRATLILIGLFFALLVSLGGLLVFAVWIIMPVFIVAIVVLGMYLLIHG